MELIFIRHGSTAGNLQKRYIGRTDEPLSEEGIGQIHKVKEEHFHPDRIYVSPMKRTRETAELLFPGIPATPVEGFRETDFGIFEGKTAAELSDSVDYRKWLDSFCQDPVPGGESVLDFKRRCCSAFEQVTGQGKDGEVIAFVVHGGTIMAILEKYAIPRRDFYDYHIRNGEWIRCRYENGVIRCI